MLPVIQKLVNAVEVTLRQFQLAEQMGDVIPVGLVDRLEGVWEDLAFSHCGRGIAHPATLQGWVSKGKLATEITDF